MNVFFSDLDNTLIYSHRKTIEGNKVLAENLDGKEQSFMTEHTYAFFRDADWLTIVPVTTRSEAQYRRLVFPETFGIRYALICNGGKLLVQGAEDQEWSAETLEEIREDLPDLEKLGKKLGELCGCEARMPECYYCYAKTDEPERVCKVLKSANPKENIRIEHDHRKVYLFPQSVNKGSAVRRFVERFQVDVSAGAGDSIIDIPMLREVDYPLVSASLSGYVDNGNVRELTGKIISDQICEALEALHMKRTL